MFKTSLKSGGGYALLVHGGASNSQGAGLDAQAEGCRRVVEMVAPLLEAGVSALDAVQAAVQALEDDPRYNAGTGGSLTSAGTLELDAAIMEGTSLRAGAVCSLPPFKNPVAVARAVLDDGRHVLYAGLGAARFAEQHGFIAADPASMMTAGAQEALQRVLAGHSGAWPRGTVGAVARDKHGHVAAATSTGGIAGKHPGRVGDSPIIGAGTYADDPRGAASATGEGEGILRVSLCARVVTALASGSGPADAAFDALRYMQERVGALGGVIVVASDGSLGLARSTRSMAFAGASAGQAVVAGG